MTSVAGCNAKLIQWIGIIWRRLTFWGHPV